MGHVIRSVEILLNLDPKRSFKSQEKTTLAEVGAQSHTQ